MGGQGSPRRELSQGQGSLGSGRRGAACSALLPWHKTAGGPMPRLEDAQRTVSEVLRQLVGATEGPSPFHLSGPFGLNLSVLEIFPPRASSFFLGCWSPSFLEMDSPLYLAASHSLRDLSSPTRD